MNNRFDFASFSRLFLDFSLVLLDRSRFKDALRGGFVGLVSDKLLFFFFPAEKILCYLGVNFWDHMMDWVASCKVFCRFLCCNYALFSLLIGFSGWNLL